LNVSYATYRNKVEPGSKETWTVKINGSKGEKAAAELLTSMYDASLDQFYKHSWPVPSLWQSGYVSNEFAGNVCFKKPIAAKKNYLPQKAFLFYATYDELATTGEELWNNLRYGIPGNAGKILLRGISTGDASLSEVVVVGYGKKSALQGKVAGVNFTPPSIVKEEDYDKEFKSIDVYDKEGNHIVNGRVVRENNFSSPIEVRKNFNETAFFFPHLYADSNGNYSFSFTMPEALTQWKWMSLAHTRQLAFGYNEQTIIAQKN